MTKYLTPSRVIIALLVLALVSQMWRRDRDSGGDYTSAERAARESIVRFATEYEAMNRDVATAIRRGDIETTGQLLDWFKDNRDVAEERAFADLNKLSERDLPRDEQDRLDRTKAAAFHEAKARGFGSIK